MTVRNPARHAGTLRRPQDETAVLVDVGMHNSIFSMRGEEPVELLIIKTIIARAYLWHTEDVPAQRQYLIIVMAFFLAVHHEIKLYFAAVDSAVIIHQHRFQPTAVHDRHNLQHTNAIHDFHSYRTIFLSRLMASSIT
ncbi:hypothetical protein SD71_13880 [Cohnella kolymensis]|uniref:Ppx/GppA phosphatase domain-containing protein n=1 Tax=Cohnella kolymensis TaxID=1590652 RepID=A0ABR5A4B8_9BACL|nr:hypothetical protein SD71_13880 [Cohnella kolymensis]